MKTTLGRIRKVIKEEMKPKKATKLPDYVLRDLYAISGWTPEECEKFLPNHVQKLTDALRQDGKVPSEEEWSEFVDATHDQLCPMECQEGYPATAQVLMDILLAGDDPEDEGMYDQDDPRNKLAYLDPDLDVEKFQSGLKDTLAKSAAAIDAKLKHDPLYQKPKKKPSN